MKTVQEHLADGEGEPGSSSRNGSLPFRLLRVGWTILTLVCSLPILGLTFGTAAWNGVNFAVSLYLVASCLGWIGLLAGTCAVFSSRRLFWWITFVGAMLIAGTGIVYAVGFLWSRDPSDPWNSPFEFATIRAPLLLFYFIAISVCSLEAWIYSPFVMQPKPPEE
jgi:hypothetical protein